jgi:hypothetical protein
VSFSSSLTLTAISALIISTLIWSQHSIGSPTQFFNPSPHETLNSPQLSMSTAPYPTSIPSFADEELPPLTSDVLTLASTISNTHTVTAIQNRVANVTVDAPPVAQNLSTTNTQTSDTKYNNMIGNSNIDNNIYVNITNGSTIRIIPYLASLIISPVYPPHSDLKISLTSSSRLKNNPPTIPPDSLTEPKSIHSDIYLGTPTSIDDFGNAVNLTTPTPPSSTLPQSSDISPSELLNQRFTVMQASGQSIIPAHQSSVAINLPNLNSDATINITFQADYAPATRYWVTQNQDATEICPPFTACSFILHLDQPVANDTPFSWTTILPN